MLGIPPKKNSNFLSKLKEKLDGLTDLILIIFDNAKNQSLIEKYLTINLKVKNIVTTRCEEWTEKIKITQLSTEHSIKLLQTQIGYSNTKEEIEELIEKLEGWPIAILASSTIIIQNGFHIKAFLNDILIALGNDEKIQKIVKSQFCNITTKTESILEILSVCDPNRIPESMIE